MYCPKCGKELADTTRFCVSCGYQVPATGSVTQGQRQQQGQQPFDGIHFASAQPTSPSSTGMGVSALQNKKTLLIVGIAAFALVLTVVLILVITKPFAKSPVANVHVGDIIHLGEVSFNAYHGGQFKDDIAWRVLAIENGRVLVIAEDVIELRPYNETHNAVTWEQSTLRQWLNTDFYNGLPQKVKQYAATTLLINADNPTYGTPGGNNTTDKVFLLSIDEANKYFRSDADRRADPNLSPETIRLLSRAFGYDVEEEMQEMRKYGEGFLWWLRSPGFDADNAALVYYVGEVRGFGGVVGGNGGYVGGGSVGVRPALWLNL